MAKARGFLADFSCIKNCSNVPFGLKKGDMRVLPPRVMEFKFHPWHHYGLTLPLFVANSC